MPTNTHPREHFIITAGKLGAALPLFVGVRFDRMKAIADLCAAVGIARRGIFARQVITANVTTQLLPDVHRGAEYAAIRPCYCCDWHSTKDHNMLAPVLGELSESRTKEEGASL